MGLACLTLAMLALALPDLVVVLAGMVVAGFVGPWLGVAGVTAFQRRTPSAMMGRVFGVLRLTLTIPQAASIGIGAALITVVNYRVLLIVIAVVAAASGLFAFSACPPARRRAGRLADENQDLSGHNCIRKYLGKYSSYLEYEH